MQETSFELFCGKIKFVALYSAGAAVGSHPEHASDPISATSASTIRSRIHLTLLVVYMHPLKPHLYTGRCAGEVKDAREATRVSVSKGNPIATRKGTRAFVT